MNWFKPKIMYKNEEFTTIEEWCAHIEKIYNFPVTFYYSVREQKRVYTLYINDIQSFGPYRRNSLAELLALCDSIEQLIEASRQLNKANS